MFIEFIEIRNFRKLHSCRIDLTRDKTVFVGANNSGKTSAMDALILFLKERSRISTRDFTLSNWKKINAIGRAWMSLPEGQLPDLSIAPWEELLPQLDLWLAVSEDEIHYISDLIPTLDWTGGRLGLRLRFEPKNMELFYKDFTERVRAARKVTSSAEEGHERKFSIQLWPKTLWDFLERSLTIHFGIKAYILDEAKLRLPEDGRAVPQALDAAAESLGSDPLAGLIKVDIINAQRGFSDPNNEGEDRARLSGNLSQQLREYYARHLNPSELPTTSDMDALQAMEDARESFDSRLLTSFGPALQELEQLNYPGFGGNPSIRLSSKVTAIEGLSHSSAVQFELLKVEGQDADYPWGLPEKYNGLGYQNLISMVFKLIRFRDEWIQAGKLALAAGQAEGTEFQPLHLVLVEEPEAHLHAQVQQVFIRKAYDVLCPRAFADKYLQLHTQLLVSTHSSHIAHEIEFISLRYFRRRPATKGEVATSTVTNLSSTFGTPDDTTRFAIRYLKATHSDLFFADAVILVEGQAERMLVPHFIRCHHPGLSSCYISILEIGGSHAHKLRPLLEDLGITTLIITDLDPVDPGDSNSSVFPERGKSYLSQNSTLSGWLPGLSGIDDLLDVVEDGLIAKDFPFRVAFQQAILAKYEGDKEELQIIPYTFEAALALQNRELFRKLDGNGLIRKLKEALDRSAALDANDGVYKAVRNGNKAVFALELLFLEDPKRLQVPDYIANGLKWLESRLDPKSMDK